LQPRLKQLLVIWEECSVVQDLPGHLLEALKDRYILERELGRGGMASVYLAHDLKHHRQVALKVLSLNIAEVVGKERFAREIQTAARLQHPNILPVFDSGDVAGRLWYTMPYVEGETLRGRLRRQGRLELDDAIHLVQEIADGLDYAHRQGVVHRDVKPENVLLSDGHALVADFGIARSNRPTQGETLTAVGLSLGTPTYMSPEQALGERDLDGCTDQYALACLCWELLVGLPPFRGSSNQSLIAKHIADPIPDIRQSRGDVPAAVADALHKAMSKTPEQRFATVGHFARALAAPSHSDTIAVATARVPKRFARHYRTASSIGAGLLLVIGLTGYWLASRWATADKSPILAVLPFENQGMPEDEYFADGLSDEVRGKLTQLPGLAVVARSSSGTYKKTSKPPKQIAHELGARYLLTGTVRWNRASGSNHVRVSPELVEVHGETSRSRWQAPFDASMTDVFQVQADIAERVARELNVQLNREEQKRLRSKPTENLIAYDAYLHGLGDPSLGELELLSAKQLRQALTSLERAVTLDSTFASAWASLAKVRRAYALATGRRELLGSARDAADRAVRLDPNLPVARVASSRVYRALGDSLRADRELEQALRLAPNDPDVIARTAVASYAKNPADPQASLDRLQRAKELNPRSPEIVAVLLGIQMDSYHFVEAIQTADHLATIAPRSVSAATLRGAMRLHAGDSAGARRILEAPPATVPMSDFLVGASGMFWLLSDAQRQQLRSLPPAAFASRIDWAFIQCRLARLRDDTVSLRHFADSLRMASEEQLRVSPPDFQLISAYAWALSLLGRQREAHAAVQEYRQHPGPTGKPDDAELGEIFNDIGPIDSAIKFYGRAISSGKHPGSVGDVRFAPHYARLRSDPRFRPYLERLSGPAWRQR
jgi:eukaryotic-like serine/threonine-protein kinase